VLAARELGRWRLTADKLAAIFGTRLTPPQPQQARHGDQSTRIAARGLGDADHLGFRRNGIGVAGFKGVLVPEDQFERKIDAVMRGAVERM
jgi:hypothetical protein